MRDNLTETLSVTSRGTTYRVIPEMGCAGYYERVEKQGATGEWTRVDVEAEINNVFNASHGLETI